MESLKALIYEKSNYLKVYIDNIKYLVFHKLEKNEKNINISIRK